MADKRLIEQIEIEALRAQGYSIALTDNYDGRPLIGLKWKVTAPDGSLVSYEWLAVDAWVAAQKHARAEHPSPALPSD